MPKRVVPDLAIMLAGGEGTRLRPITYEIPKPLIPVHGKPVSEHIIWELARNGVRGIVMAIGYKADMIEKHFGDGSALGVNIKYSVEDKPLGTGGAAAAALSAFKTDGPDDIVITTADNLFEIDLAGMYELHRRAGALATIAVRHVDDVTGYGVVELSDSEITSFIEKPDPKIARSRLINAGIYIIKSAAFSRMPDAPFSMERDFFHKIAGTGALHAFSMHGRWLPIDTMERYEKAIKEW